MTFTYFPSPVGELLITANESAITGIYFELTGFGGGIERKRWLLEHEGALMRLGG